MSASNLAVVDTNVLVYAADESPAFHEASRVLRDQEDIALAITPQILMEFYVIITDPRRLPRLVLLRKHGASLLNIYTLRIS